VKTKRIYAIGVLALAITFLLTGCQDKKAVQPFSLKDLKPVVLEQKGNEIFQYWEFENKPLLWGVDRGQGVALKSYQDSLELELGTESFRQAVQKEASQSASLDTLHSENGDVINAQLVHSGSIGKIRPINLLEAELLNYQLVRYPLLSHPTEFHAFILFHDSLNHVKVYFAASDQPWPPKPNVIVESIKKDLIQGWNLEYHLHNHYEPKSNHYIGILAPSLADAQFFTFLSEDFDLDNALITNGFHTVEIKSNEFPKFKAHSN
jgi:hypothetical protein